MKKIALSLLLLLSILANTAYGQQEGEARAVGTVYFGLTHAQPIGHYRQHYGNGNATGVTFGLLVNPLKRESAVEVGLQVSYLSQGISKIKSNTAFNYQTLKTAHSIIPLHLVGRVKGSAGFGIKPYLDVLAGISIFNTRTKIKEDLLDFLREEHEPIVLSKHNSVVMNYGIGAGIMFNGNKSKETFADLRIVYLQSPLARYVQRGHIDVHQDGYPIYNFSYSETCMLMLQLNITGILTK